MNVKSLALRAVLLSIGLVVLTGAFYSIQLGPNMLPGGDLFQIWSGTHGLRIDYGSLQMFNPPWALVFLWPITLFPFRISWSLYAATAFLLFVASVPRTGNKYLWAASVFLLLVSYQTLRQLLDGNLEAVVIAGTLLFLWALRARSILGIAIAVSLLTAKLEETWLLLGVIGLWLAFNWPRELKWKTAALILLMWSPLAIWKGADWVSKLTQSPLIPQLVGGRHNVSITATLERLGFEAWTRGLVAGILALATLLLIWKIRGRLTRFSVGALIITGMLVSPYSSNTSVITPFAVGIVPLLAENPKIGFSLERITLRLGTSILDNCPGHRMGGIVLGGS